MRRNLVAYISGTASILFSCRPRATVALVAYVGACFAPPAFAFKIDPWSYDAPTVSSDRIERQLDALIHNPRQILLGPAALASRMPAAMGQLKEPVHENLTALSLRCAAKPRVVADGRIAACDGALTRAAVAGAAESGTDGRNETRSDPRNDSRNEVRLETRNAARNAERALYESLSPADAELVRAVRWSDAPPMVPGSFVNPSRLVCGEVRVPENALCWALMMSAGSAGPASEGAPAADTQADAERARLARVLGNLLQRSHYGDLQFLHAMASPGEARATTHQRMLAWAAFAYQVAAGSIPVTAKLDSVPMAWQQTLFNGLTNRTVHSLFETRDSASPATIRALALGALLHMVQDSYSSAHAARQRVGVRMAPVGALLRFHDYGCQNPSKHADADRADSPENAGWLFVEAVDQQHPITQGAQLVAWARAGVAWEGTVERYVAQTVFPLAAENAENVPDPAHGGSKDARCAR
jgi:hypothetical protein